MDTKVKWVLVISLGIAAFFLIYEHWVHIFGNLIYLFFAIFIGLHLLMHIGHGGHGNHEHQKKKGEHHG